MFFFMLFSMFFPTHFDVFFNAKNVVILIKKNNEFISKFLDILPHAKITPVIQADLVHGLGFTFARPVLGDRGSCTPAWGSVDMGR